MLTPLLTQLHKEPQKVIVCYACKNNSIKEQHRESWNNKYNFNISSDLSFFNNNFLLSQLFMNDN